MLSINEICTKTGLSLHTFQSWRRDGRNLLPKPVGVDKKVIYFDESILDRIQLILDQKAAGKTLDEINALFDCCQPDFGAGENDRKSVALATIFNRFIGHDAELQFMFKQYEAALSELLDDYKQKIHGPLHDFRAVMAQGHLAVFLSALSASGLGTLSKHILTQAQAASILNLSIDEFAGLVQNGVFTKQKGRYAIDQLLKWLDGRLVGSEAPANEDEDDEGES